MGVLIGEEPTIKYILAIIILVIIISGGFIVYDRWFSPRLAMPAQPPVIPLPNFAE